MRNKSYFSFALLTLFAAISCKNDFLDEELYSSYTPESLSDSLGYDAALVGLYNHVSTIFSWSDQQGWPSVWQVGTDVANATANRQGIEIPYYEYNRLTSTDGAAARTWDRNYILINMANTIIAGAENPEFDGLSQVGKDKASAEARFFRAYAYNNLVTCFGPVPLKTDPTTQARTDYVRTPVIQIDSLIEADLLFAVTNLPDMNSLPQSLGTPLVGRANRYMAMQLLGEAYLRMDEPAKAEEQLSTIISDGQFSLVKQRYGTKVNQPGTYYSDMFAYGNQRRSQGNTEAIWVLEQENPNSVVGGITDNPQQRRVWGASYHNVQGMTLADSLGGRALARLRLSNWVIYGLYQDSDIRNSQHSLRRRFYYNTPGHQLYGQPVPYTGPDTLANIAPHTTKWYQFDPNDTFGYAMVKDFILMRLGETYLLLAEAQFKQGKLQEAANSINVLRERAFPDYPAQGQVSATDIDLDFILDERVRELVGEENRRMTLMRTGTLVERATRLNSGSPVNPITGISSTHLLMPIPLNEIQLNKDAVLEQNPGYGQ